MWRALFEGAGWLHLPILVMILFLLVFIGVLVWVVRRGRRGGYDRISRLPLDDDQDSTSKREQKNGGGL